MIIKRAISGETYVPGYLLPSDGQTERERERVVSFFITRARESSWKYFFKIPAI